jgi:membrane-associated phospholipid phosphatase
VDGLTSIAKVTAHALMSAVDRGRRRTATMSPAALVFSCLIVVYIALTLAIVFKTPVLDLDQAIVNRGLRGDHPQWFQSIHAYVSLGQRRLVARLTLPILCVIAWRRRSPRPLVMLVVALILLNLSVGIMKLGTGRLGPRGGHAVDQIFAGGDIYPSGHVSNAVVMYGLIAMVVAPRLRSTVIAITAFLCVTVGAGTLYLNTHWLTDVVGGWLAGGLVLCALPWLTPPAERLVLASFTPLRALVSLAGGAAGLYLSTNFVTQYFGSWINNAFGGWLAAALGLSIVPWLTPPLERRLASAFAAVRARTRRAEPVRSEAVPQAPDVVASPALVDS